MRFTFTEKKVPISDKLKEYAEKKIGKLDKFFRSEADAYITFSIERGRHIAEVTLKSDGMFYRVTEATGDMYASIDSAAAAIERQIRKNKTRLAKRLREGILEKEIEPAPDLPMDEDDEGEEKIEIIRRKQFSIKPMSPEEAVLQMNLLGHEFFAFKNSEDDNAFAVVYKRKQGGYGLFQDE
ncbi:MAG: ribosome-associated translation inhibitor RaiA [Oscillospiraceae bacterium]|nr:ribosome-associated translation inhibitor RaiA [Oscillospiraceae bacterium]